MAPALQQPQASNTPSGTSPNTPAGSAVPARRWAWLAMMLAAAALLMAACGSSETADTAPASPEAAPADDTDGTDGGDTQSSDGTDQQDSADTEGDTGTATGADDPEPPADQSDPEEDAPAEATPVVFADDFATSVAPILNNNCASCHNSGGPGSSHWRLGTAQDAADTAQLISAVVGTGYMPPWPASDLSVPFLSDDEIQAITDWAAAGGAIDVAPDTAIASPTGVLAMPEIDLLLEPLEPFDGSPARLDDYRCVIYDPQLSEDMWLQAFNFVADQTAVVHHAVGSILRADTRALADAEAAKDDAGGWECFGGTGLAADDEIFLAWAPGQDPTVYPADTGVLMQPGDYFVIQIHYHYEVDAPADLSQLELDFADVEAGDELGRIELVQLVGPAEIPCSTEETGPLCDRDAAMERAIELYGPDGVLADGINWQCGVTPADFADMVNGIASSSCDLPVFFSAEIFSIFGHMHEIGTKFRLTLNPDTPDEQILLDIPDWDFDWQYNYRPTDSIVVQPGDIVRIECTWDRALIPANAEPRYIFWADGTEDEMCYSAVTFVEA